MTAVINFRCVFNFGFFAAALLSAVRDRGVVNHPPEGCPALSWDVSRRDGTQVGMWDAFEFRMGLAEFACYLTRCMHAFAKSVVLVCWFFDGNS